MVSSRLRIGLAGAGHFGRYHALKVAASERAMLAGVFDPDNERAKTVGWEAGGAPDLPFPALLAACDALVIAAPAEAHHALAAQALRAGKHVLVEKPVGASVADVEVLAKAARESGKLCVPAHNSIYMPEVRQIKRRIDDGSYGQIVSAWFLFSILHPPEIAVKYPGTLRQIATHHFFTLLYLLGIPARLTALVSETRAE